MLTRTIMGPDSSGPSQVRKYAWVVAGALVLGALLGPTVIPTAATNDLLVSTDSSTSGGTGGPSGNNGDVKVNAGDDHASGPENDPHVCTFFLSFDNFDAGQTGAWWIEGWDPTFANHPQVLSGTYTADNGGAYRTPDSAANPSVYSLPDGHYKLFWQGRNDQNVKHKVFWVDCPTTTTTTTGTQTSSTSACATSTVTSTTTVPVTSTQTVTTTVNGQPTTVTQTVTATVTGDPSTVTKTSTSTVTSTVYRDQTVLVPGGTVTVPGAGVTSTTTLPGSTVTVTKSGSTTATGSVAGVSGFPGASLPPTSTNGGSSSNSGISLALLLLAAGILGLAIAGPLARRADR